MTADLSIVLFCFFAKRIGFTSDIFFPQYASERFHLILRKTPWFLWAQSFGSSLMQGLALPLITSQLQRQRLPPRKIDLTVIYFSLAILTAGFFFAWRVSIPIVFGAGKLTFHRHHVIKLILIVKTSQHSFVASGKVPHPPCKVSLLLSLSLRRMQGFSRP